MCQRVFLRFAAIYTLVNFFNFGIWILPFGRKIRHLQMEALLPIVRCFGEKVLGLDSIVVPPYSTGSSDTSYDWAFMILCLLIAFLLSVISAVWLSHLNEANLTLWLRVVIRYGLAGSMLAYGVVKVLPIQFSAPSASVLAKSYGDSSPMELLWVFMGFSPIYCTLAGMAELLGGAALFFRRTTLIGSLISAGILLNVGALNFLYDVPVKLFSLHYFVAALYLILPYRASLVGVFWSHQAVDPLFVPDLPLPAFLGRWRTLMKWIVVLGVLGTTTLLPTARYVGHRASEFPFAGVFDRVLLETDQFKSQTPIRIAFSQSEMQVWSVHAPIAIYRLSPLGNDTFSASAGEELEDVKLAFTDRNNLKVWKLPGGPNFVLFTRREVVLTPGKFHWVTEGRDF